jgi:predicted dehydrogenase
VSERIRIGIAGAGAMGEVHCRVASQLIGRFHLIGVHDTNHDRARTVAQQFGIEAHERLDALLERVDAIVVATPPAAHASVAIAALAAGRHVLVEKPIAAEIADGERIADAARRARRVCLVGHIERYNPTFPELVSVLGGERPMALSVRRLNYFAPRVTDTDVTVDLLIHDVDLVLELAGEAPATVSATGMKVETDRLDHVEALLSFSSGIVASLTASRITEDKIRRIDVVARGRYIVADLLRRTLTIHQRASSEWQPQGRNVRFRLDSVTQQVQLPSSEPLQLELADFAGAIQEGREPEVGAEDGIRALALVQEIQRAAEASAPPRARSANRES